MANDVQDVSIKLKPEIDAAEYKKQMSQIAKESKTAAEQAFKQLDTTMKASLKKTGEAIRSDRFLDDFVDRMRDLNQQIRETGNMPDRMTTKLYQARQDVIKLDEQYRRLLATQKEIVDTGQKYAPTKYFEQITRDMQKAQGAVMKSFASEDALQQQLELVRRYTALMKQIDTSRYKRYNTLMSKRADLLDMRGEASSKAELAEIDKRIQGIDMALRTLKKDASVFEEMRDIEGQLKFEGSREGLKQIHKEIANIRAERAGLVKDMKSKESIVGAATFDQKYQLSEPYKQATTAVEDMETKLVVATARVNELENASKRTASTMSRMRNTVWAISRLLGNFYTLGLDIVRSAKMIANYYKRIFGYLKQVVGWAKRLTASIKGTADEHKKSWKQMLRDVLRYSFGIRSLFMLFRRLRRYIKEAFEAMAEQIPEVNALLNDLKASLGMLKGSLATAFEPILSAVAPALLQLIDLLAKAITYIGMFFAAFTGRGYVYKATKAIQGMAGAAKELNKQLQGFDELNNLTSNNDSGSGSGPLAMFEKVDVPDWIKKIVDFVKKVLAAIWAPIKAAWDNVKDYVINSWKYAMREVKELLLDVLRDFLIAWQELGQGIFEKIFKTVGNIGRIVGNIAKALRRAWNYNQNGLEMWRAILTIIDEVVAGIERITDDMVKWTSKLNLIPVVSAIRKWLQSLIPVVRFLSNVMFDLWDRVIKPILTWAFDGENSGIARLFDIFKGFNEKVDWNKLRENLQVVWDAIGRFGQTVGDGLLTFIERMADNLANWINSDDFVETCNAIADFLDNISAEDVADDLEHIFNILSELVSQVYDALSYVVDHKDEILDFAEKLAGHLDDIVKIGAFGKLAIDIGRFLANTFLLKASVADLTTAVKGLTTALGGEAAGAAAGGAAKASGGLAGALGPLLGILAGVAAIFAYLYKTNEKFKESIDESVGKMTNAIDRLKKSFGDLFEDVDIGDFSDVIDKIILLSGVQGALEGVVAAVGAFVQFIADLVDTLSSGMEFISNLGATIRDLFSLGWSTFTGDIDGAGTALSNFITDMQSAKDNFVAMFDSFKQSISDAGSIFSEFFDKYYKSFSGLSEPTKSKLNSILGFFESFANGVIDAMNAVSNAIAGSLNTLASGAVGMFGGSGSAISRLFGSTSISGTNFGHISIPRLATGAVIPPNREFLAVLGDQKRGTNIESPLSTMVEAFTMANKGGNEQELALLQEQNELLRQLLQKELTIGDNDIFKSVRRSNKQFTAQNGYSAFA